MFIFALNIKTYTMTLKEFLKQIKGTQFQADMTQTLNVNDGAMAKGTWNLIISIRDVKLFSKGIKPHRNWRITDVKRYFGVKGGTDKVLEQLEAYKANIEVLRIEA